jgi:hypothetical protein
MDTFQLICGSIMALSICLMAYLTWASRSGRLSNILMALGMACEALSVFAPSKLVRVAASLLGVAFIASGMIPMIRTIYASSTRSRQ